MRTSHFGITSQFTCLHISVRYPATLQSFTNSLRPQNTAFLLLYDNGLEFRCVDINVQTQNMHIIFFPPRAQFYPRNNPDLRIWFHLL